MELKNDTYRKVNDYNLEGNRENFQLFLQRMYRTPGKAFFSSAIFFLLGLLIVVLPHEGSVKFSSGWSVWVPAILSAAVGVGFFIIGIRSVFGSHGK